MNGRIIDVISGVGKRAVKFLGSKFLATFKSLICITLISRMSTQSEFEKSNCLSNM